MEIVKNENDHASPGDSMIVKSEFITDLPKAPPWFVREQISAFKKYGEILITASILKSRHIPTLEILAVNIALWITANKAINDANKTEPLSGYIQTFKTTAQNISPLVTLKEKAEKQIFTCLRKFGLDPKSEKDLESGSTQLTLPFNLADVMGQKVS
tara:strand:+ start:737 stop:1207 length:471 start_codon:yes stop_codon:yes gene_type:complete